MTTVGPPAASALSGHDTAGLPEVDLDAYNQFLRSAKLEAVEQLRVNAERAGQVQADTVELAVTPEFAVEPDRVLVRYDAVVTLASEAGVEAGTVGAVIALAFSYDGPTPSTEIVTRFALTTGMLVAHPYVRETVQTLAARVGFPQVTLPLVPIAN